LRALEANKYAYTVPLFLGSGPRGNRFSVARALRLLLVAGISSAKHRVEVSNGKKIESTRLGTYRLFF
jgi:hypothetical protein